MNEMDLRRLYRKRLKEAGDRIVREAEKGRGSFFSASERGILDAGKPKHLLGLHRRESKP